MSKFFLIGLATLVFQTVPAQLPKIDTDRPDQTESCFLVPKGFVQFESGFDMQQNDPSDRGFVLPTLLSKYGVTKRFELRLISTISRYTAEVVPARKYQFAVLPFEIGAKVGLWNGKKWIPGTTLLFHFMLPKPASKEFQTNHIAPNFRFSMQNGISRVCALGYNVGMEWDGFSSVPAYIYTVSPGFDLSEKWYCYVEAFGSLKKGGSPEHSIDGGVAYYITPNLKVDLSSGSGISQAAPDWYVSVGCSFRFKIAGNKK